jgi:hypothetical protein
VKASVTEVRWKAEPVATTTNGAKNGTNGTHSHGTAESVEATAADDVADAEAVDTSAPTEEIQVEVTTVTKKRRWFRRNK